ARWSDITVNGDVVSAVNDSGNSTIDRSLTYLYTVKEQDAPSVTVTQTRVTNFITEDLTEPSDNVKKKDNTSRPFGDAKISIAKEPAIASVNTVDADKNDKTDFSAAGGGAYVEIGLNEAAAQWIQGGGLDKIKVSIDGGATLLPVQWKTKPTGGDFTDRLITESPITLPANGALVDEPYRAEVFLQYDDAGAYDILIGQYKDFKVLAAKYPTGISIDAAASYPPGNVIYFKTPPTMKAVLSPEGAENYEPTPVITWSSSAPDVATIEASTGKVNAVKEGDVKFTASVQGESGKLTATTETLTVVDSGEPFIDLPDTITTRIQTDTTVTWTTNVVNKMTNKSQEAKFTVTVKNLSNQTVNEQIIIDKTSCVIPGAALTVPSAGVAPAYTVTVTCKNPDDAGAAELTDTANIVTRALPLVVRFNVLESYYITDETTTVPLTASFGNRDTTSGAAYNYKVVKNGEAVTVTDAAATGYMNETKTFDLAIDSVSSKLRDIYIVSIEAYNPGDELSPSTDSFILYVYQNGVIDITAGGNQATALTLNNAGKTGIADKLQPVTATGDITKLRENANLQSTLSIDSKGYAWSNVEDQIQWSSDDDLTASLNYQQGGFYGNINDYDYTSYRPSSEFMLVGHRDGTAKITATHAKTSESAVLNVDVTTLKDKLYVFNIFPRKITTLTYTNGASTERKLTTNSYGEIAIYEPDGIASDISATSGAGDTLMMGTIYSALLSSEKDPSKMELYPVNIFKLRPAAKVELFILKEDGTPLTGNLTVSGGVYKNGKYCTATQIKDEPYAIDKDGKLTIAMDPDKFWATSNDEGLTPSDQLDYVFIARTPGDEYYPLYIKVDGSVNADDSVVFATNAVVAEKVPSGKKNKPFISEIAARHTNAGAVWSPILRHNGIIGISDAAPEMEVNTTVLWWGENAASGADYTVYFEDAYGKRFDGQRVSSVTRYPFSDLAVSENVTVLNKDTILAKTGETLHPKTRLQKGSSLVLLQDTAFTIINGVGLPDMTKDQNLQNNLDSLLGPGGNGAFGADGSDAKFNQGGDMSSPGLAMLFKMLKTDFSSDYLTMKFKPTTNPLEWEFYIQVGLDFIGDSNTNADGGKNQMMIDQSANKFSYL
ncbi:MAG: Ig-like domain-containing protein, partial [Oscillospiraceae bacterium]|nr:Ig-like domain-containing protein [Oscillospiraceae bacterium]